MTHRIHIHEQNAAEHSLIGGNHACQVPQDTEVRTCKNRNVYEKLHGMALGGKWPLYHQCQPWPLNTAAAERFSPDAETRYIENRLLKELTWHVKSQDSMLLEQRTPVPAPALKSWPLFFNLDAESAPFSGVWGLASTVTDFGQNKNKESRIRVS